MTDFQDAQKETDTCNKFRAHQSHFTPAEQQFFETDEHNQNISYKQSKHVNWNQTNLSLSNPCLLT